MAQLIQCRQQIYLPKAIINSMIVIFWNKVSEEGLDERLVVVEQRYNRRLDIGRQWF